MNAAADVVVVGGGIIGVASAERLARSGLSVVIVDEEGTAKSPSSHSGGLVRAFDLACDPALAVESLQVYRRRGWRGMWPRVRERGSLVLAPDPDSAAAGLRRLEEAGGTATILTQIQLKTMFPELTVPDGLVGIFEGHAGWLPAQEVVDAMLTDAGSRVRVLTARVTGVRTAGSRVTGVHTTGGRVDARAVVLAAGVGSSALARSAGVELPLRTRAVSYCVFQPPAQLPSPCMPVVVDMTTGAWMRPWHEHEAVLAGVASTACDVPATVSRTVPDREQSRIRSVLRLRDARLGEAPVIDGVTAYDAMSPSGKGSITAWPQARGLVSATGWNGGGFKIAPAVGVRTARLVREVLV